MRPPRPDDVRLWRQAMRDVAPLPGRQPRRHETDRRPPARIAEAAGETPAVQIRPAPPRSAPQPAPPLDHFAGIDRANAERLKRGRRAIEARLDLHGMTQIEAHQALAR